MKNSVKVNGNEIKFYYNGIKVNSGKLQKCYYDVSYATTEEMSLKVYAEGYTHFTEEIREMFSVINDTDIMTDYFEKDRFVVPTTNPYYKLVLQAAIDKKAKRIRWYQKNLEKFSSNSYMYKSYLSDINHLGIELHAMEQKLK